MPFYVGSSPTLWKAGVVRWLPGLITLGCGFESRLRHGGRLRSLIGQNVRLSLGRIRVRVPSQSSAVAE
jgi:hypothetical protein